MTDISETIARLRPMTEHAFMDNGMAYPFNLTKYEMVAILAAAEAGVRARDAALDEAVECLANAVLLDTSDEARAIIHDAMQQIRALKGRPT